MKYWDISPKNPPNRYLKVRRWYTYSKLIKYVLEIDPSRILEIGIGNRLVMDILKKIGYDIKGLDIDKSLNPDFVMDVRDNAILNFKNQFDLIISSQMLEHIEYTDYIKVINNLSQITENLIITLPYCDKNYYFCSFNIIFPLFFNRAHINKKGARKWYYKKLPSNYHKYHYWEIGTKGFSLKKIKKDLKNNGWIIQDSFFDVDYPYHFFFILLSKNYQRNKEYFENNIE